MDSAIDTRRRLEQATTTPQVSHLPIFGVTKGILLALRCRLEDGQVCIVNKPDARAGLTERTAAAFATTHADPK